MRQVLTALKYFKPPASAGGLTKELLLQSVPGALASGGLTGLMTGDPLAGLAVGGTDLLGSTAIARALGSRRLNAKLAKMGAPNLGIKSPLGGRWAKVELADGTMGPSRYLTSVPQNVGIMGTTFMTPMLVEPMFAKKQQQQLAGQGATTAQQLTQRQNVNQSLMTGPMSAGTMFQLAGTPVPNDVRGIY
tara:strand:+ start:142 stop:711 length:570 start_codon:yes stop_codon:yes gene_type:complete